MFPARLAWFDPAEAVLEQELFELEPRDMPGGNMPPAEPKPRRTYKRRCPETGQDFETTGKDRQFASDQAKADFHNRSSKIGRKLVPLAMAWRAGRNAKGNSPGARALRASASRAFNEMCRQLDAAAADDAANGRMRKLDYVRQRDAIAGDLSPQERASYQAKVVAAQAVVRERLGEKALDLTVRQLDELAAKEVARAAREEKAGFRRRGKAGGSCLDPHAGQQDQLATVREVDLCRPFGERLHDQGRGGAPGQRRNPFDPTRLRPAPRADRRRQCLGRRDLRRPVLSFGKLRGGFRPLDGRAVSGLCLQGLPRRGRAEGEAVKLRTANRRRRVATRRSAGPSGFLIPIGAGFYLRYREAFREALWNGIMGAIDLGEPAGGGDDPEDWP